MVGYTAMMQEDEQRAITNRARHREILRTHTRGHNGKILQYFGDGTLSIYESAIEAVLSAIDIQKSMREDPEIPLRIGIHIGDIVFDDEGVYGDGVNVASRVESIAVAGSIFISGKVYDEISNQPSMNAEPMGQYKFKNVSQPVEVFAVQGENLVIPVTSTTHRKAQKIYQNLAVLPFVNMSNDIENEYFAEGISEELINALTKIDRFMVTARTSSFVFKGKNQDIREIGKTLQVEYVVEGSVRKAGNRVRITAQLIRTSDGFHIWSEVYDRNLEDIFALQDEISGHITETLKVKLGPKREERVVASQPTTNLEAYNAYLKGKYYWNKISPDSANKAIACYEDAIEKDNEFALAYISLATCIVYLSFTGYAPPIKSFPKARQLAEKAIKLDNKQGEAYFVTAMVKVFFDLDWVGAEKDFEKALKLKPNNAETHLYYGFFLAAIGNKQACLEHAGIAYKMDPLSLPVNLWYANFLLISGDENGTFAIIDKMLEMDPNFRAAIEFRGWVYYHKEDYQKAIENFAIFKSMTNNDLKGNAPLGCAYAASGDIENAEICLAKIYKRADLEPDINLDMDLAMLHLAMKNYDKVFYHLKESVEKRVGVMFLSANPFFEELRTDQRYEELLNMINIKSITERG